MSKHGKVLSLSIPRPNSTNPKDASGVGLIYVEFDAVASSLSAHQGIQGRTFGGNTVGCFYYPEDKYAEGERVDISKPEVRAAMAPTPAAAPPAAAAAVPNPATAAAGMGMPGMAAMPAAMAGVGGMAAAGGMAPAPGGRGRGATLPAWMTKGQ